MFGCQRKKSQRLCICIGCIERENCLLFLSFQHNCFRLKLQRIATIAAATFHLDYHIQTRLLEHSTPVHKSQFLSFFHFYKATNKQQNQSRKSSWLRIKDTVWLKFESVAFYWNSINTFQNGRISISNASQWSQWQSWSQMYLRTATNTFDVHQLPKKLFRPYTPSLLRTSNSKCFIIWLDDVLHALFISFN